jgi:predicted transcriptional regulator
MDSVLNLLKDTKIKSILTNRKLVRLNYNDTIEEAISKLSQNKILSAPIYKDNEYIGLVDYNDISKKKFFFVN